MLCVHDWSQAKYPNNALLLRSYAHFLISVKREVKRGRKIMAEADRIQEQMVEQQASSVMGGGNRTEVDDKVDAVVVINKKGIIISVNKNCSTLFGHAGNDDR